MNGIGFPLQCKVEIDAALHFQREGVNCGALGAVIAPDVYVYGRRIFFFKLSDNFVRNIEIGAVSVVSFVNGILFRIAIQRDGIRRGVIGNADGVVLCHVIKLIRQNIVLAVNGLPGAVRRAVHPFAHIPRPRGHHREDVVAGKHVFTVTDVGINYGAAVGLGCRFEVDLNAIVDGCVDFFRSKILTRRFKKLHPIGRQSIACHKIEV